MLPAHCPVLDIPLDFSSGTPTDNSPTLDRVVPAMGYVKGNVLIVSMRANRIKSDASVDELQRISEFYSNLISKGWMK